MIECSSDNIWYKKRNPKRGKRFCALFLSLLITICFILYYRYIIVNNIYNLCSDYTYAYCTETSNNAVINSLDDTTKYTDLITIEKDNSGEIILMSANTLKINTISREIVRNCSINLDEKIEKGIPVPILAFSGIGLISGYGKIVNLKTLSVSSVSCDFLSDFKSVGINQTLHCIYVELTVSVDINLPLSKRNETVKTKVLISESVLVGKVPDTYLNGNLFTR